ncbi:MAG: head decoration protein [Alphaproteobacteria bacterium]|nr:MAG: head decoration protein [Alphaproteobacteria bacterium]
MTALVQSPTLGDLLKYELEPRYSRELVTLKAGAVYALGAVLGKITASGIYRLSPMAEIAGDEGAQDACAVLLEAVDAVSADAVGLVAARGPVLLAKALLSYDPSVDQPSEKAAKIAQLAAHDLVARDTA